MASYGFSNASIESLVSFLKELSSGEWASEPAEFKLPESDEINIFAFLKFDMSQTIFAASQLVGSDISVTLKNMDVSFDELQDRLTLRIDLAKIEGTPEQKEAARRCGEKLIIVGITRMTYKEEIANARLQVQLATQPALEGERPLHADVALLGIGGLIEQIKNKADEFDALYRQSEKSPSLRIQEALRDCGRALNNAYETLQRIKRYAPPHGALAQSVEKRLATLDALRAGPAPAPKTSQPPAPTSEPGKD